MLTGPAVLKPSRVCLEVAADEAAGDALAQRARVARAQAVDVVLALRVGHGVARVLELGHALDEVVELLVHGTVGLDDGEEDVVSLGSEVGDGLLVVVG